MRLFAKRKDWNPEGDSAWGLWRWIDVGFMTRLCIVRCPLFEIALHWIKEPSDGNYHDHPAAFVSFFIKGSYTEVVGTPHEDEILNTCALKHDFVNYKPAHLAHRIAAVEEDGAITLVLSGRKKHLWSIFTPIFAKPNTNGDVSVLRIPQ